MNEQIKAIAIQLLAAEVVAGRLDETDKEAMRKATDEAVATARTAYQAVEEFLS